MAAGRSAVEALVKTPALCDVVGGSCVCEFDEHMSETIANDRRTKIGRITTTTMYAHIRSSSPWSTEVWTPEDPIKSAQMGRLAMLGAQWDCPKHHVLGGLL
jgi:hypothetical protein